MSGDRDGPGIVGPPPLPGVRWRPVRGIVVAAAMVAGGWGWLQLADPWAGGVLGVPCVFRLATDLYCPGCGGTRAAHALVHGEWALAWRANPFAVLILPFLPLLAGFEAAKPRGGWSGARTMPRWLPVLLLAVLVAFAFARNTQALGPYLAP